VSSFSEVSQEWLVRFVEHRIGDKRIVRLIQKWLKAGVLDDGIVVVEDKGTGQGAVISPLLANVYLHYVFDLWAHRWRQREAKGAVILVRYADDIVVGFQYESDAKAFWDAMRERLREFSLSLHEDKSRLIEFGRFAAQTRARRGQGKPETFDFLAVCRTEVQASRRELMMAAHLVILRSIASKMRAVAAICASLKVFGQRQGVCFSFMRL
jgi:hypothetical protein